MDTDWIKAREVCSVLEITRAGLHSRLVRGQIAPIFPPPEERRPGKPLYFSRQAVLALPRQRRITPAIETSRLWPERECSYLAGIIDGEGCITIASSHRTKKRLILNVSNTHVGLIQWIEDIFGPGTISHKPLVSGWKPGHVWSIGSVGAYHILRAVLPHLIVKREQAILAIRYQESISAKPHWRKVSPDEKAERDQIQAQIRALHKKGRHP